MLTDGQQIGRYRILSAISAGGMGEVFLAEDIKLERKVALKILPAVFAKDAERMRRFEREAKATSALNHPNIITIYEIGEFENTHFIATEYIEGETLRQRLKEKSFSADDCLELAIQMASALQAAHGASIVHRDIKPENIMIRPDGLVKVLDFGIAKLTEKNVETSGSETATAIQAQTALGMIIGTAAYMSPEQAQGKPIDARSDIFSFGCVLYEMLTGRQPFAGENAMDVIGKILHKEQLPITQILPEIPSELERIINKALCKDCGERYQSTKDLLADLKELKEELDFQSKLKRSSQISIETEAQTQIIKAGTGEIKHTTNEAAQTKSIAVLPFVNISSDTENEYFCDGLAEELLNALAKIDDLKVAARSSAFSFKNRNVEISEIGRTLNVKTILEGSVRRWENRIRITVQLVNAANGFHLWSERYDREMKDIFDVQDEIALAVVDALKLKLFSDEKALVLKRYTNNPEAYQLYLKGRFHFSKFTVEGFRKSFEYYEQAIAIEPDYAPAFAALSSSFICFWYLGFGETARYISKAKAAVEKALILNQSLAEAHFSLALVKFNYERDWTEAEKAFRRAMELNPNYAENYEHYSMFLAVMGRFDEAVAAGKRAIELAPLALKTIYIAGWAFWFAGHSDLAKEQGEKLLEMDPNFSVGHTHLGVSLWNEGEYEKSLVALETAVKLGGGNDIRMLLGLLYGIVGEREKANQLLTEFERLDERGIFTASQQAFICAGLGEMDLAFDLLEQAFERREGTLVFLKQFSSLFPKFHNDSRMTDLLNRIGLPTDMINQTDESLEAKTVMLSTCEATSEPPAKDFETENAEMKTTAESMSNQKSEIQTPKSKWWLFGLLSLIALVGGFFGYKYFSPTNKQIESIAVMPFENKSGNADSEYLSDGLAESLIYRLSQLPNLKVSPTSSVSRYKGKETDPIEIGNDLGVKAVMTGRIVQRGDNLTISVELVDVRSNKLLWGEQYERKMSELLITQREIAAAITQRLQLKLSGDDARVIMKGYTDNDEANQLYLKGRYYLAKETKDDILRAIAYFQQAIKLDPKFALAYVGIADGNNYLPSYGYLSPNETIPKAKAAARRALEIDPDLAEARTALAGSLAVYDWDWAESEREFKRALALNPNIASTYLDYGIYHLTSVGRTDEAIAQLKRAFELEPLSTITLTNLAGVYVYARQNEQALEQAKRAQYLEPTFVGVPNCLVFVYNASGNYSEAISLSEKLLQTDPNNQTLLWGIGYAYAKSGRRREAGEILKRFNDIAKTQYVTSYFVAQIYAGLGESDKAFAELDKAFTERDWYLPRLMVDPFMESLRDDPRFADLVRRIGLPPPN